MAEGMVGYEDNGVMGREPRCSVTIGPYLARRLRRMGPRSEKELQSHRKLPMMGTLEGPGGSESLVFLLALLRNLLRRDLREAQRHTETGRMNQVSIRWREQG